MPNHSRHVGQALKFADPGVNPPLPWQRVIGSSGAISSRGPGTNGAQRQREALEAEGVEVTVGRAGEFKVDMRIYGWFPDNVEILQPEDQDQVDGENSSSG
ncbi:hypothetical protein E1B28_009069 [Marasmius oreades]|nr:uncharacterized protein E1B28_009069 [Marasmius oreades]KAG7092742.1 hypothetical protein E1B28_009069 [Marasmius oreades]